MGVNKLIILTLIISLSGCALENNSLNSLKLSSSNSSFSQVNSIIESSFNSNVLKEIKITSSNFNKLSYVEFSNVVENTEYPEEFTFNSGGIMKSNKIKGIKEIKLDVYNIYENLKVYSTYNGTGNAITPLAQKDQVNKKATFTYSLNSTNEFYIINSSSQNRTHVYSVTIKYSGETMNDGNYQSSSSSSNNNQSSSSSKTSNSSSSLLELSGEYSGTYYNNLSTTTNGQTLIKELHKIISTNTVNIGYDGLLEAYKKTDVKPGTNIIWDMYSNESYTVGSDYAPTYKKEGDGYNREHSVPQSWFNEASPMKADLFHVYPTDSYVNGRRGSYLYGEVSSPTYTSGNGSKVGPSTNSLYSGTVFEPIDEYKGDFARTYFYMATRYMDKVGSWTKGSAQKAFSGSYPYLTNYSVDLFTKWAKQDPVSQKEINRNNEVYKLQKNRNPYIDHPEFIEIIWGE